MDRQLFMAPLADYAILHLYLLTGGDALAGLPQFLSLVLAMLAATGAVSLLGGSRTAVLVAGIFVLTLPMTLLQATGTENDLMAACLLTFVYFLLSEVVRGGGSGILAGGALGLLLLTKQTGGIFATPLVALGAFAARSSGRRRLGIAVAIGLVINAPMLLRNVQTSGGRSARARRTTRCRTRWSRCAGWRPTPSA